MALLCVLMWLAVAVCATVLVAVLAEVLRRVAASPPPVAAQPEFYYFRDPQRPDRRRRPRGPDRRRASAQAEILVPPRPRGAAPHAWLIIPVSDSAAGRAG